MKYRKGFQATIKDNKKDKDVLLYVKGLKIRKDQIIKYFKKWLSENIETYFPCHGDWEKSIEIREDLIECHWDEPHGKGLANHCRIIPLTKETAEEFNGYTIDIPEELIRR